MAGSSSLELRGLAILDVGTDVLPEGKWISFPNQPIPYSGGDVIKVQTLQQPISTSIRLQTLSLSYFSSNFGGCRCSPLLLEGEGGLCATSHLWMGKGESPFGVLRSDCDYTSSSIIHVLTTRAEGLNLLYSILNSISTHSLYE